MRLVWADDLRKVWVMPKIVLGKDWNKHKEGTTVVVDDLRAAWLKKAGFEAKKGKKSK